MPEGTEIPPLLEALAARYADAGVNLVRIGNKWTFRTAPDLGPRLKLEVPVKRKLSRAAVETMAVIAYHQPTTRSEIEVVRGVALSKGTLETLVETGWVKMGRRRQTPGRPATWITTEEFLDHFGLASTDDLPGIEELKAAGFLEMRPVLTSMAPPDALSAANEAEAGAEDRATAEPDETAVSPEQEPIFSDELERQVAESLGEP